MYVVLQAASNMNTDGSSRIIFQRLEVMVEPTNVVSGSIEDTKAIWNSAISQIYRFRSGTNSLQEDLEGLKVGEQLKLLRIMHLFIPFE